MKRPITFIMLGLLLTGLFIFTACASLEQAPAQATKIALTVESGVNTVQTILTPQSPMTPTPEGQIDLTKICIPPLGWEQFIELSLPNNLKISAMNDWLILSENDVMKATAQATETKSAPFTEQGVDIEFVYTCGAVYINPDSR